MDLPNIYDLHPVTLYVDKPKIRAIDKGAQKPDDGGMESRVKNLENFALETRDRLARMETRMEFFATKSDIGDTKTAIAEAKSSIIMWVVGAVFLAQLLPAAPKIISAVSKMLGN